MAQLPTIDVDSINDLDSAKAIIRYLLEENRQLKERVQALEIKIAQLEKNSSTSSKPPSSDIVKPPHEQRQRGKRRSGGQPGHPGVRRAPLPPDKVDHILDWELNECPLGHGKLDPNRCGETTVHQVAELVDKPVEVTEYRQHGHWCPHCRTIHYKELPEGVVEGQLCGMKLQALVGYLKGNLGASYSELAQFFEEVLGLKLSRSVICNIVGRVSKALKVPYEELGKSLPNEPVLNIDETGWKDSGRSYWVWIFCTPLIAYFTVSASRGSKVLKEVLGETFGGAIISDFYSAYVKYANAWQQFCLAHLIRDIKFLETLPDKATQEFGEVVLGQFRSIFRLWHKREQYSAQEFQQRAERLKRRLYTFLHSGAAPPGKAATLNKRLVKHWESLFRFLAEPRRYEPTNNLSEQTLRALVRIRRQTQGTRSRWGREWTARVMSVLESCRKQKRSPWQFILSALQASYAGTPAPSLLPVP